MMKQPIKIFTLFSFLVLSLCCSAQTASSENSSSCQKLPLSEAEKILRQSVRLVESKTEIKEGAKILRCKYSALSKDEASGQEINLFFKFEESPTIEQAKQIYERIWQSNKNHQGVEALNGLGDEAYFQRDGPNVHFVLVRKGKFTLGMKVNRPVKTTSVDELKAFIKKVIGEG